jgi:hypothetical protein
MVKIPAVRTAIRSVTPWKLGGTSGMGEYSVALVTPSKVG